MKTKTKKKKRKVRDTQKKRFWESVKVLQPWEKVFEKASEAEAFMNDITDSRWHKHYEVPVIDLQQWVAGSWPVPCMKPVAYDVCSYKVRSLSASARRAGLWGRVRIPKMSLYYREVNTTVLLWAMASCMRVEAPYTGRQFIAIHRALVKRWMGEDAWRALCKEQVRLRIKAKAMPGASADAATILGMRRMVQSAAKSG